MKDILIICLLFWTACKSKHNHSEHVHMDEKTEMATPDTMQTDTNHIHIYTCPMHAEVTGKDGDKCKICGMSLVHKM